MTFSKFLLYISIYMALNQNYTTHKKLLLYVSIYVAPNRNFYPQVVTHLKENNPYTEVEV